MFHYKTKKHIVNGAVITLAVIAVGIVVFSCFMGKENQLFQIVLNLSYSYLAGFIFYILTVTIPRVTQEEKAKLVFSHTISVISMEVEKALNTLAAYGNIHKSLHDITVKDCKDMVLMNAQTRVFRVIETINRAGIKTTIEEKVVLENSLSETAKSIKKKINFIFSSPECRYLPEDLQIVLTEMVNSKLLEELEVMNNIEYPPYQVWFRSINLAENYVNFIPLFESILRYNSEKLRYDVRRMTPEEIKESDNQRKEDIPKGEALDGVPVIWVGAGLPPCNPKNA